MQYVDCDAVGTGRETGNGALHLPPIGRIVQIHNGLAVAINYDFGPAAIHRSSVGIAKAPPFKIEPDRSAWIIGDGDGVSIGGRLVFHRYPISGENNSRVGFIDSALAQRLGIHLLQHR